jgi:Trp operon repressor
LIYIIDNMSSRRISADVNVTDLLADNQTLATLKWLLGADEVTPAFIHRLQVLRTAMGTQRAQTPASVQRQASMNTIARDLETLSKRQEEQTELLHTMVNNNVTLSSRVTDLQQTMHHQMHPVLVRLERIPAQSVHKMELQEAERIGKEENVEIKDGQME